MVRLQFTIALNYEVFEAADFIFNICAAKTPQQSIVSEQLGVNLPVTFTIFEDGLSGNRHIRLHTPPGQLNVSYAASVDVEHYFAATETLEEVALAQLPSEVLPYLYPSRYCQSDQLSAAVLSQFGQLPKGYGRIEAVRQWVQSRTKFLPGSTNSYTTALDTYVQQHGVCRDFAHVMIAACRALNVPARFVTGLDYGTDPSVGQPDFHAYVEVFLSGRWYLFDPSGLSMPMGLPRISTARDAGEAAFATIFGRVRGSMPVVNIRATTEGRPGLIMPYRTDQAISTGDMLQPR